MTGSFVVCCLLQIWEAVKEFKKHCTPGGGKDSMSVFYDAGLLFESSAAGTPYRHGEASFSRLSSYQLFSHEHQVGDIYKNVFSMFLDLMCPSHNRRKRDTSEETGRNH